MTEGCPDTKDESKCVGNTDTSTVNNHGWIRWIANGLQLFGYYMLIHDGFSVGLFIKGVSDLLIITWGAYNRLWDVVVVTSIFTVMNFNRLIELKGSPVMLWLVQHTLKHVPI